MAEVIFSPAPSKRRQWILRLTYSWWYPKIKDRMRYLCGAPPNNAETYTLDLSNASSTITFSKPPSPGTVISIIHDQNGSKVRIEGL